MTEDLRILISVGLKGTSIQDLNKELKKLSDHPSLQKLELKVKIDESFLTTINKFNQNIEKFGANLKGQSKVVQEFVTETIKLDGSIEKVTRQILANGEQIEKSKIRHDQNKKAILDESNAYSAQAKTLQQLEKELQGYTLASQKANKNKLGQVTSYTNTYKNDSNQKVTVNTDQNGNVKNLSNLSNYLKQQQDVNKQSEALDRAHYQALKTEQDRALALDKLHYQALKQNAALDLKNKTANDKQYESLDRAHYNALKTNQERIEAADKAHYQALKLNAERDIQYKQSIAKAQLSLDSARARYGTNSGISQGLDNVRASLNGVKNIGNYKSALTDVNNQLQRVTLGAKASSSATHTLFDSIGKLAKHVPVLMAVHTAMYGIFGAISSGFKGMIDIEAKMAGYIQTNEAYFKSLDGHTLDQSKINDQTKQFINTAHSLGAEIGEVTESARLWGRMYKDVAVVQELVRQSTQLSTVDLVSLEDATKSMESVMAQYGVQIKNVADAQLYGNRVLDAWSSVAHETMAPAKDLGAAFERTGKIASETGVSFDFMNGLVSSGIRNTALSGENLGNMWKTVLGTIRTGKAVDEIEKLGVKTKEVVNGTEQWKKAEDILLELSTKVIDKNYDLTQSYADISRGVYQYAKLAASLNAGDILLGTSASINSTGSTAEYLIVQMDTIQRKASQVKTSFLEVFNTAGDNGLRTMLKDILDTVDDLLLGINKIPSGAIETTVVLTGLVGAAAMLKQPVLNFVSALNVLRTAREANIIATTAETVANNVNIVSSTGQTVSTVGKTTATAASTLATEAATVATEGLAVAEAGATVTMGLMTGGISILVGLLAVWAVNAGSAEKKQRDQVQATKDQIAANNQLIEQHKRQEEFLPKATKAYRDISSTINVGTKEQIEQKKKQLKEIEQAILETVKDIDKDSFDKLKNAGFSEEETQKQIELIKKEAEAKKESNKQNLLSQSSTLTQQISDRAKAIQGFSDKIEEAKKKQSELTKWDASDVWKDSQRTIDDLSDKQTKLIEEQNKAKDSLGDVQVQIDQSNIDKVDQLAGSMGKLTQNSDDAADAAKEFTDKMDGYADQLKDVNQVVYDLNNGQSITSEKMYDLIKAYPQLAGHIKKTTDGWKIETTAVEDLRKQIIKSATEDIQTQKNSTFNTLNESLKRIKIYGFELKQIGSIQDAKNELNKLNTSDIEAPKSMWPGLMTKGMQEWTDKAHDLNQQNKKEAANTISSFLDENEKAVQQLDEMLQTMSSPDYGVATDKNKDSQKGFNDTYSETNEILTETQKQIKENIKALNDLQNARIKLKPGSKEYRKSLEDENKLLEKQNKLYQDGINHPEKLVSTKVTTSTKGSDSQASSSSPASTPSSSSTISTLLSNALGLQGKFTYKQIGGEFKGSYDQFIKRALSDCSQFVQEMFKQFADTKLPRTAAEQAKKGVAVSKENLQAGDLVFFNTVEGKPNSHVGIYTGNGKFIQMGNGGLKESDLNSSYWAPKYNGARRILSGDASASTTPTSSGKSKNSVKGPSESDKKTAKENAEKAVADNNNTIYQNNIKIIQDVVTESKNRLAVIDALIATSEAKQSRYTEYSAAWRKEEMNQISNIDKQQAELHSNNENIKKLLKEKKITSGEFDQQTAENSAKWWELEQEKADKRYKVVSSFLAEYDHKIDQVKNRFDESNAKLGLLTEGTKEYNETLASQTKFLKDEQKLHKDKIDLIQKELLSDKLTAAQKAELVTILNTETAAWLDNEAAIKGNLEKQQSLRENAADKIIEDYKDMIKKQQDLENEALDQRKEAEDERHNQVKKNLEDEAKDFEDKINRELKAMDRLNTEQDYNSELNKKLKERQEIQDKINILSMDTSTEGKLKLKGLQDSLDAKDEEIAKYKLDRNRELQQQNLNDQLDDYKKHNDQLGEEEDDLNKDTLESIDTEKKAVEQKYKDILENDKKYYELKQGLLSQNESVVKATLKELQVGYDSYFDKLKDHVFDTNQEFENLNYTLQKSLESLGKFSSGDYSTNTDFSSGYTPPSSIPTSDMSAAKAAWSIYLSNKQQAESLYTKLAKLKQGSAEYKNIMNQINSLKSSNDAMRSRYGFPDRSYADLKNLNIFSAETGGYTGDWSGDDGKFLLAHKKELILNKTDTSIVLQAVNVAKSFTSDLGKLFSSMSKPMISNTNSKADNKIELTVNIENLTGDKAGVNLLTNGIMNSLNKLGFSN